jgi:hypothetical protein
LSKRMKAETAAGVQWAKALNDEKARERA